MTTRQVVTEELIPAGIRVPISSTVLTYHNDRLDLLALRVYGSNHSAVLRTLLWANNFTMDGWLQVFPEGIVINTPPVKAQFFTTRQKILYPSNQVS